MIPWALELSKCQNCSQNELCARACVNFSIAFSIGMLGKRVRGST